MADVTEAAAQDQIAESLLGDQPTEATTDPITAGPEAEVAEEQVESQAETEQVETEESADDWLPTEQDRTFSDEALLRYAARYQKDAEWLSDPLNRQLLTDKLNSDIYLRQQQEQQPLEELGQELPQEQQEAPAPTLEQHLASLNQWSEQHTDPRIAQAFADNFMKAFGVNEAAKPETAIALSKTMGTFGMNLIQTALPQVLPAMLDQVMPGFSGMYYQASRASSWDGVRNSSEQFANLPAYGTREFMEKAAEIADRFPALTQMGITLAGGGDGSKLHGQAADQFYRTLAQLMTQPQADPQLLQQAAEAGARSARRGEVRRSAGNLGAGQSKGVVRNTSGSSKFQTNSDLFDDEAMGIWQREHGKM